MDEGILLPQCGFFKVSIEVKGKVEEVIMFGDPNYFNKTNLESKQCGTSIVLATHTRLFNWMNYYDVKSLTKDKVAKVVRDIDLIRLWPHRTRHTNPMYHDGSTTDILLAEELKQRDYRFEILKPNLNVSWLYEHLGKWVKNETDGF